MSTNAIKRIAGNWVNLVQDGIKWKNLEEIYGTIAFMCRLLCVSLPKQIKPNLYSFIIMTKSYNLF